MAREAEQNAAEGDGAVDQQDRDAVARLEAEVAALRDQLLRALADQENVRRRAARERDDAVRFAAAAVIKDLLPTADSIRRAIESIPEQADQDELIRTLLAGVAATEKAMLDALARHGIQRIEPAPGEPFDPRRHHAMMEIEDPAARPGTVKEVLQSGYAYHDRLLRPALVGVARGGAGAAEQGGGTAGRSNDRERPSEGADNGEV